MIIAKILVFIIVLTVIITIHELGHFFTAKKFGILCHEFSIGMGPAVYKKKKGETTYAIRAIPIGGYVSMAGEQFTEDMIKPGDLLGVNLNEDGRVYEIILDDKTECDFRGKVIRRNLYGKNGEPLELELTSNMDISNEEIEGIEGEIYPVNEDAFYVDGATRLQIAPFNRCLESKPLWQRFIVLFAGAFMNFVLAIVIGLICFFVTGTPKTSSSKIGHVDSSYIASSVLNEGDEIEAINGISISSWTDFKNVMNDLALAGEVSVTIKLKGVEEAKETPVNVAINSIGISNLTIKDEYKNLDITGAQVGSVGPNYKNDVSKKVTQLSNGDIITAINVYEYGASYDESMWSDVTSWKDITMALKDADIVNVYFRYYDAETNEYHDTYIDKQLIESYGNEVLTNQRIDKIKLYLGIQATYHHNFFESIKAAAKNFWSDFTLIFRTLKLIIHPSSVRQIGVDNLSGVVGIYSLIGRYMNAGIIALLLFMALLSVNIGIMNLLPIPALDGGRILFILIEAITRKPINRKVEAIINNVMFILLMLFMVYIAYNDITRLIKN